MMSGMEHALRLTGSLEPRGAWQAEGCTIAQALDVIPTRSAFLILREAFYGTSRFDEFAQRVGISEPVTAARLRELVENGLLEREDYQEPGQRAGAAGRAATRRPAARPQRLPRRRPGSRCSDHA